MRILKTVLFALALAVAPSALGARVAQCSSQAVAAGVCRAPANTLACYDVAPADAERVLAAYTGLYGYQLRVPCDLDQQVDEMGALMVAGVRQRQCHPTQIGSQVDNPQGRAEWVAALLRWRAFIEPVIIWESRPAPPSTPAQPDVSN